MEQQPQEVLDAQLLPQLVGAHGEHEDVRGGGGGGDLRDDDHGDDGGGQDEQRRELRQLYEQHVQLENACFGL